jgi:hypothetical protein
VVAVQWWGGEVLVKGHVIKILKIGQCFRPFELMFSGLRRVVCRVWGIVYCCCFADADTLYNVIISFRFVAKTNAQNDAASLK